jgi:hypothetical protein
MSPTPLALLILLLGTLPAMGATIGPEIPALSDRPRGWDSATEQAAPQSRFHRAPPFAAGPAASSLSRAAPPALAHAAPQPAALSGTDLVQLPLPGAMPLLLGALAGFIVLGRRRSRPPGHA